jgi:hypothetical protein
MNNIAFFKQKFGQVRAVLSGNPGNEGDFTHFIRVKESFML